VTAEDLAERFDIGIGAARIRLEELERMRRRKKGVKRPLPPGVLQFLRDARKKGMVVTSIDDESST
jgi:hypothetical protein